MIVSLIFVAIVLALNIYDLIDAVIMNEVSVYGKGGRIVGQIFVIIALIVSIIYISSGFNKTSAKYFKFFLYTFTLAELIKLFNQVIITKAPLIVLICAFVAFILLNVLFGTKDLGKNKSLILSSIILVCVIFIMIYTMCDLGFIINLLIVCLADISLSAVLVVMMLLKYYDKALRNTK